MAEKGFGVKDINLIGPSGTPTITSPNNLNLNANNVAISTNVSIGGTLTVTGNVSVGGTLTYEDVTSIDSVGIVTARTGVVTPNIDVDDFVTVGSNIQLGNAGVVTATTFSGSAASLTNLPVADSDIQVAYTVTANGSSAYRFAGNGVVSTADDPDLYLIRGKKYRFINNSGGSHPFQIREASGGTAYSTGVTNNGASSGNIDFAPTFDSPAQLVYQCTSHSGMVGNIYLRGGSGNETNVGVITATGAAVTGGNMFIAKMNSGYNTSHNTDGEIVFQNEVFDSDGRYNNSNGRFTPNVAGYYFIDASLQFSTNSANNLFESTIWKNGAEQFVNRMRNPASNSELHCKVSGIVSVNGSSDYISIAAWQNSGGNLTVNPGNGSYFMGYFLRPL